MACCMAVQKKIKANFNNDKGPFAYARFGSGSLYLYIIALLLVLIMIPKCITITYMEDNSLLCKRLNRRHNIV